MRFLLIVALIFSHQTTFAVSYNYGDSWCPSCQATPSAYTSVGISGSFDSKALIAPIVGTGSNNTAIAPKFIATIAACFFLAVFPVMVAAPFVFLGVSVYNGAKYGKPGFYFGSPRSTSMVRLKRIGLKDVAPKLTANSLKFNKLKFGGARSVDFSRIKIGL